MNKALIICDAPKGVDFFRDFLIQNDCNEITVVESGKRQGADWWNRIMMSVSSMHR